MEVAPQYVLRESSPEDLGAIVALINRAFAVERFFKTGDRTDAVGVGQMMQNGPFLLLTDMAVLVACVFVKVTGERGYIGTLSVDPAWQRAGIGTRMMREAEDYLRAAGCKVVDIRIVSVRPELAPMYRKFGYIETGTQSAEAIRTATRPVHFITMSKQL